MTTSTREVLLPGGAAHAVAMVSMNDGMQNSMTTAVTTALISSLHEAAKHHRAVVLRSAIPGIFSSGLSFTAPLAESCRGDFISTWSALQALVMTLHEYPIPVIAALDGTAFDEGLSVALACDARVATESSSFGFVSIRSGFPRASWEMMSLRRLVGKRHAERLLLRGDVIDSPLALSVGLLDDVADHGASALDKAALDRVALMLEPPFRHTWWLVKDPLRKPVTALLCDKYMCAYDTRRMFLQASGSEAP